MAQITVYLSEAQRVELLKISKKTGVSASRLLLKGFSYWLSNNPKDLKYEAKKFKSLMEEREAKQLERDTGDYIGSFEKLDTKLNRIESAYRKKRISREEYLRLKKITKQNYSNTQRKKRIRLGLSTKEDRLKELLKKHPRYKVTKGGKIKKK